MPHLLRIKSCAQFNKYIKPTEPMYHCRYLTIFPCHQLRISSSENCPVLVSFLPMCRHFNKLIHLSDPYIYGDSVVCGQSNFHPCKQHGIDSPCLEAGKENNYSWLGPGLQTRQTFRIRLYVEVPGIISRYGHITDPLSSVNISGRVSQIILMPTSMFHPDLFCKL